MEEKIQVKKKSSMHPYLVLIIIMIIAAIGSYFIPAGEFTRVAGPSGRMMIDPSSFQFVERPAFSFLNLLTAIPRGVIDASSVIIAVLMIGGSFHVIKKIGVIEVGVNVLVKRFANNKIIIIPVLFTIFAVIAAFVGSIEMCLIYIPIMMPLLLTLGYDSMVTVAIALLSTCAGFTAALTNPYTIGIGHTLAELPMYSGMGYRAITLVVMTTTGFIYIMAYARKIQNDPTKSLTPEADIINREEILNTETSSEMKATGRQKLAGLSAIIVFVCLIIGTVTKGWSMTEMAGCFILFGAIPGFISGMTPSEVAEAFTEGFKDILVGAMICGIARGIAIVMTDAMVIDTIIYYLSDIISALPKQLASIGMMIVVGIFNGFVPSGSGKALITMPIMLPLADFANINRQIAILAYQFGDGVTNVFWPASGYFVAALAMAKVSYSKWIKFVLPLLIIWLVEGAMFLVIADLINWGPF